MSRTMDLRALLAGLVSELPPLAVTGLSLDSRAIAPGEAFVALAGTRSHGLAHAVAAVDRGAACVLFEPPAVAPTLAVPAIPVPGLRARLGEIADRFHEGPSRALTVIGVTGTNGKTSTVQLLAQALSGAGHRVGTIGTLGAGLHGHLVPGERTTPDVLAVHGLLAALRTDGATHVAMEVSSHALEQGRVDAVAFALAVFTNLTRDHLDYHGTMDAYFAAKAKLFERPGLQVAVIGVDDDWGRRLAEARRGSVRVLTCSAEGRDADLRATAIRATAAGLAFRLHAPWGDADVATRLLGRFNVANLLGVAGCLGALGWDAARIADAIARFAPVDGRMNRLGGDDRRPLVVVDYAHTPDALEKALSTLRPHTAGRLIVVFGCGGDRDAGKRPQMGAIAERLADVVVLTDDNPRSEDGDAIVAGIRDGIARPEAVRVERDRARAIALALALADARDTVLIAGKGHETYQEAGGRRLPFDDLDVARRALGEAA